LHVSKLGESGKREKTFASAAGASLSIKGHGIVLDPPKSHTDPFFIGTLPATLAKQLWRRTAVAGNEFLKGLAPRVRAYRHIRENSLTAKTKKDNERKLIYENSNIGDYLAHGGMLCVFAASASGQSSAGRVRSQLHDSARMQCS
jgi:hypothetical protein